MSLVAIRARVGDREATAQRGLSLDGGLQAAEQARSLVPAVRAVPAQESVSSPASALLTIKVSWSSESFCPYNFVPE